MMQCLVNPLFLFLAVWGAAAALYLGGVSAGLFQQDAVQATYAVCLNVATFAMGYLTWSLFRRLDGSQDNICEMQGVPLTAARLKRSLNITLAFGFAAVALCALRIVALSGTYQIELSRLISNPILWRDILTTTVAPNMYALRLCTIGITVASAGFSIGFLFVGILLYFGRGWRRYSYVLLFLLVSLGVGMLSLGRKEVTINILFMFLSYLFMHRLYRIRRLSEVVRHLVLPLAALGALFLLINLLLRKDQGYEREGRLGGFLFSIYWYIASPLAAFAQYLQDGDHTWLMGQGLFFPAYKWLARLHLLPPVTKAILTDMIFIPYPANVYTYLRDIYEDLGLVGIAVVPYSLGFLSSAMRRRAEIVFPYLNLYLVLLAVIVFSFYDYLLVSNQLYLQVFFALLLFRFQLTQLDRLSL